MSKKVLMKVKTGAPQGFPGFLGWLAETHPQVYNLVAVSDPNTVQAMTTAHSTAGTLMGDDDAASPSRVQSFVDTVTKAAAAILPMVQQQKMLKIQLQRAAAGQPPLDVGAYTDPNQGLQVGLNQGTQKTLLYIGGGVLAAILLRSVLASR